MKKILFILSGIFLSYLLVGAYLSHTEYSYREWVDFCGISIIGLVIPLLLFFMLRKKIYEKRERTKSGEIFFHIAGFAVYGIWALFVLIFLALNVDEEKRITKSLIIANEAEFLQESVYVYYEPVAFLFKKPGKLTEEKKQEYLEEKYGSNFKEKYPDIEVYVYRDKLELMDNFIEEVAVHQLLWGHKALNMERNYYLSEPDFFNRRHFYLEISDKDELESFSREVSELLTYVTDEEELFRHYRGSLCFYQEEGEMRIEGILPFGKLNKWDKLPDKYYLDLEQMGMKVMEEYQRGVFYAENDEAFQEYVMDLYRKEQSESASQNQTEVIQEQIDRESEEEAAEEYSLEEAAKNVYEACLADQGYTFEIKYNAKGYMFIDLGSRPAGEPGDSSNTGIYGFTLMYDRPSRNGACEIFILQKTHYTEDNMEESTIILDMYAVEKSTGKVVAGNKQSWGAAGTEEYRRITGE